MLLDAKCLDYGHKYLGQTYIELGCLLLSAVEQTKYGTKSSAAMNESNIRKVLLRYNISSVFTDSGIGLQDEDETTDRSIRGSSSSGVSESSFLTCLQPGGSIEGVVTLLGEETAYEALSTGSNGVVRDSHDDNDHTAVTRSVGEARAFLAPEPLVNTLESRGGFKRPPPARVHRKAREEPPECDGGTISCTSLKQQRQQLRQQQDDCIHEQQQNQKPKQQQANIAGVDARTKQPGRPIPPIVTAGGLYTQTNKTITSLVSPERFSTTSLVQVPPHPRSDFSDAATITELNNNSCAEVELVSLIEEQIPRYKLRADTITNFAGL
ncbi:uncharacterized protein LOC111269066 isoform X3 [Varroa jacobsoni]|uniref:uncharacterized protein LOC111269066 isoform X3 n=1 Tax=Varroa jacobsoni TaxID=62625 RepID=UPI000BF44AA6|nr:uncharacterized protein LOC111269066 isoform X3 [Varroa jacobsoni]